MLLKIYVISHLNQHNHCGYKGCDDNLTLAAAVPELHLECGSKRKRNAEKDCSITE